MMPVIAAPIRFGHYGGIHARRFCSGLLSLPNNPSQISQLRFGFFFRSAYLAVRSVGTSWISRLDRDMFDDLGERPTFSSNQ